MPGLGDLSDVVFRPPIAKKVEEPCPPTIPDPIDFEWLWKKGLWLLTYREDSKCD
jgi:hypothetical protein